MYLYGGENKEKMAEKLTIKTNGRKKIVLVKR